MATKTKTAYPKITTQHDWISVDFGNGRRLTASRSGEKGTGLMPREVFDAWVKMVNTPDGTSLGERIAKFAADIDSIWPDWRVGPKTFHLGDTVRYDFGPRRGGMQAGKIVKVLRTNYTVRFDGMGLVRISGDLLSEFN